jgi:hypothetical protein
LNGWPWWRVPERQNLCAGVDLTKHGPPPSTEFFETFFLHFVFFCVSLLMMNQEKAVQQRERLLSRLPSARDILRGSLLQRTIRHRTGCPKCARGEGHAVAVLAVGYPGGTIRQISLPQEQVTQVRRCLANYRKLKAALEKICELNQQLLRSQRDEAKPRRSR